MKVRLVATSLFLAGLTSAVVGLALSPLLERQALEVVALGGSPWGYEAALVVVVALAAVVNAGLTWAVVAITFERPLSRAGQVVEQILTDGADDGSGPYPLAVRLERSLKSLSTSLKDERARNRAQLAELKATNEHLGRLQTELVAADRLATVGKLAAGVAHEVGNPLSGILGYLSVLRMMSPPADTVEVLDRLEAEVRRIDRIVKSLLELGRPSRGAAGPIDVRSVIDSSVALVSAGLTRASVTVAVDAPDSLWLKAESGPLSQVLINLLLNAAQAMPGGGEVTVRAEQAGARGQIHVLDRGPGLSGDVQARLFEPFFTTRPPGQGTGLGLAMSKHLLAQFDGELAGANREGGGARFTITLPAP